MKWLKWLVVGSVFVGLTLMISNYVTYRNVFLSAYFAHDEGAVRQAHANIWSGIVQGGMVITGTMAFALNWWAYKLIR